jgi:uncharacterized protein YegJ (DUF2314 family)
MTLLFAIIAAVIVIAFLWVRFASPNPEFPPLAIDDDDPEMKEARSKAQASTAEFVSLFRQYPEGAMVKWPFITSSGRTEYLGAEALSIDGDSIKIRLTTPPVSHTGPLERLHTVPLKEIVDWIIVTPGDKRKGGFSMRVMFKAARKQWGDLPDGLKQEESKYSD